MAAAKTKKADKPAATPPEKAADAKIDPAKDAKKADAKEQDKPKGGPDELVKSPDKVPEPVEMTENFVKVEKASYVSLVTFYNDGWYGEVLLGEIAALVQKGPEMDIYLFNNPNTLTVSVTEDEAIELFSKWRSLKQARRNA